MNKLPELPGTNKPFIFERISTTVEHWLITYYFMHEQKINAGITITNNLTRLEEILELPKGYHDALQQYTENFNEDFARFLKDKYQKETTIRKLFTHPVDKIRQTKEGIDYISFVGSIGMRYLPVNKELQGKGYLFRDKNHPILLVAPDKTLYTYWGITNMPGQMLIDENERL